MDQDLKVINFGLSSFADNLKNDGVQTVNMDWKPSQFSNTEMQDLLHRFNRIKQIQGHGEPS